MEEMPNKISLLLNLQWDNKEPYANNRKEQHIGTNSVRCNMVCQFIYGISFPSKKEPSTTCDTVILDGKHDCIHLPARVIHGNIKASQCRSMELTSQIVLKHYMQQHFATRGELSHERQLPA